MKSETVGFKWKIVFWTWWSIHNPDFPPLLIMRIAHSRESYTFWVICKLLQLQKELFYNLFLQLHLLRWELGTKKDYWIKAWNCYKISLSRFL